MTTAQHTNFFDYDLHEIIRSGPVSCNLPGLLFVRTVECRFSDLYSDVQSASGLHSIFVRRDSLCSLVLCRLLHSMFFSRRWAAWLLASVLTQWVWSLLSPVLRFRFGEYQLIVSRCACVSSFHELIIDT
jgi:hypothetical protein